MVDKFYKAPIDDRILEATPQQLTRVWKRFLANIEDLGTLLNRTFDGPIINVTIPADSLPYTLESKAFTPNSFVWLMPLNAAASGSEVFAVPGNSRCIFDQADDEYLAALGQWSAIGVNAGNLSGGVVLPLNTEGLNVHWTFDAANDRVQSRVTGVVSAQFSIGGTYATGTDYQFGIRLLDTDGTTVLGTFTVPTSTSNQNNVVSVGAGVLFLIAPGQYVQAWGSADSAGTFNPANIVLSLENKTGVQGAVPGQALEYRALVIG